MEEVLIHAQAMAARVACERMTARHLSALQDSVQRACCVAGRRQGDGEGMAA
jgi:hypothetical protein